MIVVVVIPRVMVPWVIVSMMAITGGDSPYYVRWGRVMMKGVIVVIIWRCPLRNGQ